MHNSLADIILAFLLCLCIFILELILFVSLLELFSDDFFFFFLSQKI